MKPETLFISDLHLGIGRPAITRCFLIFLQERARGIERLFILGDLFDAYLGDDDNSSPQREIKAALADLSDAGTAIFFQHGNRDFLVGDQFCRETGVSLLEDYALIDLYGEPALLTHGDLLCTDDHGYQTARKRIRTEAWKNNALAKPLLIRQLYARWYRFKSGLDKNKKTQEIMDANLETVIETMRRFSVTTLIHGHTHRPAVHELEIDGKPAKRYVLAEWDTGGSVLRWSRDSAGSLDWFN